jgi:hypothetical protein
MSPRSKKAAPTGRSPRATKGKRKGKAAAATPVEAPARADGGAVDDLVVLPSTEAPAAPPPSEAPAAPVPEPTLPLPAPAPAPIPRSTLPDEIRWVTAHGKISQIALSDDGQLIAVASMSADRGAATLAVHRTTDTSEVCAYTVETIAGNGKAACFDAAGDLLFVAGDTLFRLRIGSAPERLGRVDCEALFRDAAGRWLAFVERSGAVRFAAGDAPLTEVWRQDAGRGHMQFGTQVRFVGETSRALIGALADRGPLLVDVAEKTVLREFPQKGACADANRTGDLVAVFEPRGRRDQWLSIYPLSSSLAGDATEPTSLPIEAIGPAEPVAFAPDGVQLAKTGVGVQLIDVATATAGELRPADGQQPGNTFTPALRAWRAPLIGWSSFNFRTGDFRAYWASFAAAERASEPISDAQYVTNP